MFARASSVLLAAALSSLLALVTYAGPSIAATRPQHMALPSGLQLSAQPAEVDVGGNVLFTMTARQWPAPAGVLLTFVSPHHSFTGQMPWDGSCSCFRLTVTLAKRAHQLEPAKVTATVRAGKSSESAGATFLIRGLAANGHGFAAGGPPQLTGWVTDPNPVPNENEHYCAWVRTPDGLGVSGMKVRFAVHFQAGTRSWTVGPTGASGIICLHRSIGQIELGQQVPVDIYAGALHAQTSFTPRG